MNRNASNQRQRQQRAAKMQHLPCAVAVDLPINQSQRNQRSRAVAIWRIHHADGVEISRKDQEHVHALMIRVREHALDAKQHLGHRRAREHKRENHARNQHRADEKPAQTNPISPIRLVFSRAQNPVDQVDRQRKKHIGERQHRKRKANAGERGKHAARSRAFLKKE